jgi:DNA-binding NtrC family response regulator
LAIRVLVVEDEPTVRSLAIDILSDAGFETLGAGDARQALDFLANSEREIDVLFTDVRMPGAMNGMELARVAKRERPKLGVIITSGYYDREELPKGANFLNKPWSAVDLVSRIKRAAA